MMIGFQMKNAPKILYPANEARFDSRRIESTASAIVRKIINNFIILPATRRLFRGRGTIIDIILVNFQLKSIISLEILRL